MRLLTPAAALISAVAIATASTGFVLKRSADDTPVARFGALTDQSPASTPKGAEAPDVDPSSEPEEVGGPTSKPIGKSAQPIRTLSTAVVDGTDPDPIADHASASPAPDPTTMIKDDGLFVVDPDTGKARQTLDRYVTDAVWLDESHVAFIRNAAMWIANADGSGERQVFAGVVDGGMSSIVLSPDRKWIAFVSGSSGSNARPAYVMRSDGTGVREMWPDTFNSSMSWSPDSTRVAFVAEHQAVPGYGTDLGLSVYHVATAEVSELYSGFLDQPTWTPDGRTIVFFEGAIVKIDVATEEYETLAVQKDFAPTPIAIDADGRHVYYTEGHTEDWWSIGIEGGTPVNLGSGSLPFRWARSNGRAAIIEYTGAVDCDGRRVTRLVVASSELTERETLAVAGTYASLYGLRWSPNGQKLLVRSSLNKTPRRCS